MSRIIVLVKYAKPKKDYLSGEEEDEDDEVDATGLDKKTRLRLGMESDEDDVTFNAESKFEKMFNAKNLEFYYKPYGVDTREVHDFYPLDDEHTIIITEYGGLLPIKLAWKEWLSIWEKHSGEAIFIINEQAIIKVK